VEVAALVIGSIGLGASLWAAWSTFRWAQGGQEGTTWGQMETVAKSAGISAFWTIVGGALQAVALVLAFLAG